MDIFQLEAADVNPKVGVINPTTSGTDTLFNYIKKIETNIADLTARDKWRKIQYAMTTSGGTTVNLVGVTGSIQSAYVLCATNCYNTYNVDGSNGYLTVTFVINGTSQTVCNIAHSYLKGADASARGYNSSALVPVPVNAANLKMDSGNSISWTTTSTGGGNAGEILGAPLLTIEYIPYP
jgi:hypothetical protein